MRKHVADQFNFNFIESVKNEVLGIVHKAKEKVSDFDKWAKSFARRQRIADRIAEKSARRMDRAAEFVDIETEAATRRFWEDYRASLNARFKFSADTSELVPVPAIVALLA